VIEETAKGLQILKERISMQAANARSIVQAMSFEREVQNEGSKTDN